MNKDRATHIENIKKLKECATTYRNTIADTPQKEVSVVIGDKQIYLNDEMFESLDYAINCVGAIEQIKWERDIAIQQLHDLGFGFGEETNKDKMTVEQLKRHQDRQVRETCEERVRRQMKEYLEPYVRSDE